MSAVIAELIRTGRLRKGLNQSELAEQAGVSRTTLHQIERGAVQEPRAKTLCKLASALDLPPEAMSPGPDAWQAFNRDTNPAVQAACDADPGRLSPGEWCDLAGTFGVGGPLTSDGVWQRLDRADDDREALRRLQVVLQTHLREPARQLIDALYQSVQVIPETTPSAKPQLHEPS